MSTHSRGQLVEPEIEAFFRDNPHRAYHPKEVAALMPGKRHWHAVRQWCRSNDGKVDEVAGLRGMILYQWSKP